jgi:hypothetical protein
MAEQREYAWVMLKKYDPRKGNVRQRYRMPEKGGWDGLLFTPEVVFKLDRAAGQWLHDNVRQLDGEGADKSPKAFHIWYSYSESKLGFHRLRMEELGRVVQRGKGPSSAPPDLTEATMTSIGDPEPTHELEMDPPVLDDEPMPVDLGSVDVEDGYGDLDPGTPDEQEKPKKTRKKPGPKPGSKRKPRKK